MQLLYYIIFVYSLRAFRKAAFPFLFITMSVSRANCLVSTRKRYNRRAAPIRTVFHLYSDGGNGTDFDVSC